MSEVATARPRLPVTAFVSVSLFFTGITYASTLPYAGIVAIEGLGISNGDYALILTIASLVGAGAAVALGYLSDRVRDRRLLVIATALLGALGYGLIYVARNPLAYIVAYCVIMPFGGALFSQTFSYARSYYNAQRPDRAEFLITILRTIFAIAWVLVPPVAGWIAATYSVFDVYALASAAYLVCALIFVLLLGDSTTRIGAATKTQATTAPANGIELPMLIGIGGVLLIMVAIQLNTTTAPLAIVKNFGGTAAEVGIYASLAALLEIPCMLAWGFAAQRFKKHWLIVASATVYALYLFLFGQAKTVTDVYWLQGFNAVATAGLMSIPISYMQEAIRGRVGLSTSLLDVVAVASRLVAAGLFGIVTASAGYLPIFPIAAGLSLGGVAVLYLAHGVIRRRPAAA